MKSQYDFFRDKAVLIKDFISTSPLLPEYFDNLFFSHVSSQIDVMEEKQWSGPINSFFLFFMQDSDNSFAQTILLEKYLKMVVEHPNTTNADRNHIKGQLKASNSIDTLFEISILGNLLKQLPTGEIELFPRTVGHGDVEARLMIDGRWVYIDATTFNDSQSESEELVDMLNNGGGVGPMMAVDFQRDLERFIRKLEDKSRQFIPNTPNVLVISFFGTRLLFIHSEWGAKSSTIVPNIGLLMEFDRKKLMTATAENCDDNCQLTEKEIAVLKELLSGKSYEPLVY
jgi:hypothetical protein